MRTFLLLLLRPLLNLLVTLVLISIGAVWLMKYYLPPYTALMLSQTVGQLERDEPLRLKHRFVDLEGMGSLAPLLMVAAQDPQYLVALGTPQAAVDDFTTGLAKSKKKKQQTDDGPTAEIKPLDEVVAHNLFYLPWDNILTRLKDKYFGWLISLIWSERRMVEVYLNTVELGPGVYGLGAAAELYFEQPPDQLKPEQLALLAACLPNPRLLRPDEPEGYLKIRGKQLLKGLKGLPDIRL